MDNRNEEIMQLALPLVEWLKKNGNPHMMIVIESHHVRVTEDVIGIPIMTDD